MFLISLFLSLRPALLPEKPQTCIQRLKILASWYHNPCPSKSSCSMSSHQLISLEDSLQLRISYPGGSVVPSNLLSIVPDVWLLYLCGILVSKLSNRLLGIQWIRSLGSTHTTICWSPNLQIRVLGIGSLGK